MRAAAEAQDAGSGVGVGPAKVFITGPTLPSALLWAPSKKNRCWVPSLLLGQTE